MTVDVQPSDGGSFQIDVSFDGTGDDLSTAQRSRTGRWRTTGEVYSYRGGWTVQLRGEIPPALKNALVPRTVAECFA